MLSSSHTCLVRYRLFYRREIYYTDAIWKMAEWKEQAIGHDHSCNVLSYYVYENKQRGWDIQTRNLNIEQFESKTLQKAVLCSILLQRPFPSDLNTIPAAFCNGGWPLVKSLPPGFLYKVKFVWINHKFASPTLESTHHIQLQNSIQQTAPQHTNNYIR